MSTYSNPPDACPQLGYCAALLKGLEDLTGLNDPQMKATPVGFLQAVLDPYNRRGTEVLSIDPGNGHRYKLRVKRLKRGLEDETRTTESCDPTAVPFYDEEIIELSHYRELAVQVEWEELRQYCADASQIVTAGGGNTRFMNDHLKKLMVRLNGLRRAINSDLLSELSTQFGINVTTGDNLAKPLPLLDSTQHYAKIEQGIQELMFDVENNEMYGAPLIVGQGLFSRFNTSAQMGCCNAEGFHWGKMAEHAPYRFYLDVQAEAALGQNEIAVFAPGTIQLLTHNRYRGSFAGKHGSSEFGTLPDPYLPGLRYDVQLKFNDCGPDRGYTAIVGLHYGLHFIPPNAYQPTDRLFGNNGILRYVATTV